MEQPPDRRAHGRVRGQRLGPYELVARLGGGGMGEVWEATLHGPSGFRKAVALKLLKPDLPQGSADDLVREARLGALLQHPNIVATLGLAETDGVWCIALELVRGLSVADLMREEGGRLPAGVVVEIGVQVAAGLQHVHTLGGRADSGVRRRDQLVHRDIKPSNLLVDRTGLVKIADLGVSALAGQGGVAGTRAYMAPEQALGQAVPASDLFALGATLYGLATGVRPFGPGPGAITSAAQVEALLATPAFLNAVDEAVPELGPVLRACLRGNPDHRFQSAQELGEALASLRSLQPPGPTLLQLFARALPDLSVDPTPSVRATTPPSRFAPATRDRFVGREQEVARLESMVRAGIDRWIVVTGLGGMGKTRLVAEVRRRVDPAGTIPTVDLSGAVDEPGVCAAVGAALGVELDRSDAVSQLGQVFARRTQRVVVLDNLEQCLETLPNTLGRWLDAAPHVLFVGTSRVAPGLMGERVVSLEELAPADAVALFLERSPRPLTAPEQAEVPGLCASLEGMPLAIELCAARLRTLTVGDVRARMGLQLLTSGRDVTDRRRSVGASLRWSWELLSPSARAVLGQLSVFEGGFRLEAAEAVVEVATGGWVMDEVEDLAEASLVRLDPTTGRFRMHPLVREFAAASVFPLERENAELRHLAYFSQLGTPQALEALDGHGGVARFRALVPDRENIVAACHLALDRAELPSALDCVRVAAAILRRQGPLSRLLALTGRLVVLTPPEARERPEALALHGLTLWLVGRFDEAAEYTRQALDGHRALQDRFGEAGGLGQLGTVLISLGDGPGARRCLTECVAMSRRIGFRRREAAATGNLGSLESYEGNADAASSAYRSALETFRSLGDRVSEGVVSSSIGSILLRQGQTDLARESLTAALAIHREVGNRRSEGMVLGYLASLEIGLGHLEEALRLQWEALALHREVGNVMFEALVLAEMSWTHLELGDSAAAEATMADAVPIARTTGSAFALGRALSLRGEAHRRSGRRGLAGLDLAEAEPLLRASGVAIAVVWVLLFRGKLAHPDDATAARTYLDQAEQLATTLKLWSDSPLARALAELRVAVHGG